MNEERIPPLFRFDPNDISDGHWTIVCACAAALATAESTAPSGHLRTVTVIASAAFTAWGANIMLSMQAETPGRNRMPPTVMRTVETASHNFGMLHDDVVHWLARIQQPERLLVCHRCGDLRGPALKSTAGMEWSAQSAPFPGPASRSGREDDGHSVLSLGLVVAALIPAGASAGVERLSDPRESINISREIVLLAAGTSRRTLSVVGLSLANMICAPSRAGSASRSVHSIREISGKEGGTPDARALTLEACHLRTLTAQGGPGICAIHWQSKTSS